MEARPSAEDEGHFSKGAGPLPDREKTTRGIMTNDSPDNSASTPADAKTQLRAAMRERLSAMAPEEVQRLSAAVCRRIVAAGFFETAETVMMYLPIAQEVDLTPLALRCFQDGKTVCVPRMDWASRHMRAVEIRSLEDEFEQRNCGVREPVSGRAIPVDELNVVLIPGLAFDTAGRRLGRGGGFYDRFLAQPAIRSGGARLCGVGFDSQVVDVVPAEPHDAPLGVIVTDRRMICAPCRRPA